MLHSELLNLDFHVVALQETQLESVRSTNPPSSTLASQ